MADALAVQPVHGGHSIGQPGQVGPSYSGRGFIQAERLSGEPGDGVIEMAVGELRLTLLLGQTGAEQCREGECVRNALVLDASNVGFGERAMVGGVVTGGGKGERGASVEVQRFNAQELDMPQHGLVEFRPGVIQSAKRRRWIADI